MFKAKIKERVNSYLNPIITKRAKAQALVEGKSLSEVIEVALDRYLPKVIRIEFEVEKKPTVGKGLSIKYDRKELKFLVDQAMEESKRGETQVIDTEEKLNKHIKKLRKMTK